jgi:hypothetical protein
VRARRRMSPGEVFQEAVCKVRTRTKQSAHWRRRTRPARRLVPQARVLAPPFTTHERPKDWHPNHLYRPLETIVPCTEIEGATLQWWHLQLSGHLPVMLVATGLPGEPRAIRFSYTRYIDCPTTMHNVKLRMATVEESEALRPRLAKHVVASAYEGPLAESENGWAPRDAQVLIECDEGIFLVWAEALLLSWRLPWTDLWRVRRPTPFPDPSWPGGPTPGEL